MNVEAQLARAGWRKSSHSGGGGTGGGDCVEIANLPSVVAVRDSKDPAGSRVVLARDSFRRLVDEIRLGGYGR